MSDVRQGLFDLLKSIIDDEWGPYDDDYYWNMVDAELPKLGLREEVGYALGDQEPEGGQPDAWFSASDISDSEEIAAKLKDSRRLFTRLVGSWAPRLP